MPNTEGGSKVLTIIFFGKRGSFSELCPTPGAGRWYASACPSRSLSAPGLRRDRFHLQVRDRGGLAAIWPLQLGGKAPGLPDCCLGDCNNVGWAWG